MHRRYGLATRRGSAVSSQMVTAPVHNAKKIRNAIFAVLVNPAPSITLNPPAAPQSDWQSTSASVPKSLRTGARSPLPVSLHQRPVVRPRRRRPTSPPLGAAGRPAPGDRSQDGGRFRHWAPVVYERRPSGTTDHKVEAEGSHDGDIQPIGKAAGTSLGLHRPHAPGSFSAYCARRCRPSLCRTIRSACAARHRPMRGSTP